MQSLQLPHRLVRNIKIRNNVNGSAFSRVGHSTWKHEDATVRYYCVLYFVLRIWSSRCRRMLFSPLVSWKKKKKTLVHLSIMHSFLQNDNTFLNMHGGDRFKETVKTTATSGPSPPRGTTSMVFKFYTYTGGGELASASDVVETQWTHSKTM